MYITPLAPTDRIVWVDSDGGLIVNPAGTDPEAIEVDRVAGESDVDLAARVARAVETSERVFVCGAESHRVEFEREFVHLTHHPERLVDVATVQV